MDLLPKSTRDFCTKEYWNDFFVKLKDEPFEWYGEYEDLAEILHRYITAKDRLLIIGCGNSALSHCLHQAGIQNQINIDISDVVVQQMQALYPHLEFRVQDATKMDKFDNDSFSCVLDKGTFDALTPPDAAVTEEIESDGPKVQVDLMMEEIARVVKTGGRFVCISLLQPHVAKKLFTFFNKSGWMMRVVRCNKMDEKLGNHATDRPVFPVFINVFTKVKLPPGMKPVIEISNDSGFRRLDSLQDLLEAVLDVQNMLQLQHKLKSIGIGANQEVMVKHFSNKGEERYQYFITDCMKLSKNPVDKRFGVLIVPEGREVEWLFGSHEGRLQLAQDTNCTRLVVVHLVRGQQYESMEVIKQEIQGHIRSFMPKSVADSKCQAPIMTISNDIGTRKIVFQGKSEYSGDFVVEDVRMDPKKMLRRLIFLNNPNVIQSEVGITKAKRQGKDITVLRRTLSCEHHQIMCIAFGMSHKFLKVTTPMDVLLVGLGGGLLASFITSFIPNINLTALDIDEAIVGAAKDWFGLPKQSDTFKLEVQDGLKYLADTDRQFDIILLDVDNKSVTDGLSCPPASFVEEKALQSMMSRLKPGKGILVLNLVCRNPTLKSQYTDRVSSIFPFVYSYQVTGDLNNLLFCFDAVPSGTKKNLNSNLKQSIDWLDNLFLDLQKPKNVKTETDTVNMEWENARIKDIFDTDLEFVKTHFKLLEHR